MKKIFVLSFNANPNAGGIEKYTFNLCQFLKQTCSLVYFSEGGKKISLEGIEDITESLSRWGFLDKFFLGGRLGKILKKQEVNSILCMHLYLLPKAWVISQMTGAKITLAVYGIECWAGRLQKYLKYMNRVEKIFSISSFTTEQILKQGIAREKVVHLPPLIKESDELSTPSNENSFNLLTVGRLSSDEKYKGHDLVIEALSQLKNDIPNLKYIIVGKGNDEARLKEIAKINNVSELVSFEGFVEDIKLPDFYNSSDLFLMPSNVSLNPANPQGEGFGIVFLEAAKYRKAILAPNIGGSTDFIINEKTGITVTPNSVDEIAAGILELYRDPEKRTRLGENAYQLMKDKFTEKSFPSYLNSWLDHIGA